MRKMKASGIEWIGEIPEGWEVAPVRSCFDEVRTKNTDGQEQNALQFKSGNIISKTNFNANTDDYIADTITNYTVVLPDTVMINGLNLNYDFKSLRVALVKEKGVITSAYLAIFPDREKIFPQYATYLFKGYETKMAFHNMGAGIRKTLGYKEFKNQPLLLPSKEDQNKISAYLDSKCSRIDIMLFKIRSSIEEYKKLKQAVITQAVAKGVRGEREMKDSGVEWIGEIPAEWSVCPLKRLAAIQTGSTPSKTSSESFYSSITGTPWIKPDNLGFSSSIETTAEFLTEEGCSVARTFPSNTVYVGCIGSRIGNCGYSLIPCACNQQINALIFNERMYWKYGWYLTIFQEEQYTLLANGNVIQIINSTTQGNISCIVPSISEQREITAYLDAKCAEIDGLITKKEQLVKELESYKKSLIYEVVTGKREV